MSKYIDLKQRIIDVDTTKEEFRCSDYGYGIEAALEYLDRFPDQVPGRTITESRYRAFTDSASEEYQAGFSDGFFFADGCVIPDPEPTNAEKLEALLEGGDINAQWGLRGGGVMFATELAHALDEAGVKAPEANHEIH